MKRPHTADIFNDLLAPFLNEHDPKESDKLLERIVCEFAQPLIADIVSYKLRANPTPGIFGNEFEDAADVRGDIALKLVKRLRQVKAAGRGSTITNLRGYVAIMAYNACDLYLRRRYPRRHSLRNKLRYVLNHQPGLALWEHEVKSWVCGFADWKANEREEIARIEPVCEELALFLRNEPGDCGRSRPGDLLAAIFDRVDGPVDFDELVGLVADLWGVRDQPFEGLIPERNSAGSAEQSFDPRPALDAAIDQRQNIERLWVEIRHLPPRQRTALLLHARDSQGTSVVALLPRIGIATIRVIAETLSMPAQELASLWKNLPLEDSVIAQHLGATRQQVINLRKSARERLARRMAPFE